MRFGVFWAPSNFTSVGSSWFNGIFRDPQGHGTPENGKRDPYDSHTTPIRIPKDMGIVWEAYHKAVPLLGVPGITLDW